MIFVIIFCLFPRSGFFIREKKNNENLNIKADKFVFILFYFVSNISQEIIKFNLIFFLKEKKMLLTMFTIISMIITIIMIMNKILLPLFKHLKRRKFVWTTNNGQYWAVVTGSTDGLGFEFARQLAQKGYNLIMISRNEEKLLMKKELILKQFPSIQIEILAIDFQYLDVYEKIEKFLQKYLDNIFILVNNVGFFEIPGHFFYQESNEFHQRMMNVNVISTIRMTELILPKMIEKRRGLIINVSSIMSHFPGYQHSMYAATKVN